jgi:type VI protein secretion system component VasF
MKIERWEAGFADRETMNGVGPLPAHVRREDGRQMVAEHLAAFEQALTEAGHKTQAIMAAS